MSVYGITWADINGNSNFVFDANINSVRTWITVSTDTTESVARKFQVTMYRGVAGGGQVEVTTLTAKYVRTENNVRLYQAEYIFNVADWIQFRPNDNNYVTVWVNTPESLYTSATVKFMYMPTINSIRITSNLPDSSIFVQSVTPFNIEVEAEGYDGATIQAVTADIQSTANPLTEVDGVWAGTRNAYTSYGTVEFWVRATDQYQVTKLQTVKLSVKKHDVPAITTDIYRCDSDGTKNENGAYLSVTAYASSVPTALGIYSLYLEGTIIGASSSIIAQYINSGQTYILGNGGITSNDSYNLTFTATDKAAIYGGTALSVSVIVGVPKVVRIINIKDGGKGVAFGKVAETDNLVDSAWDIKAPWFDGNWKYVREVNQADDLNTVIAFGKYAKYSNGSATKPSNCPTDSAFTLYVFSAQGSTKMNGAYKYGVQLIREFSNLNFYFRFMSTDGNGTLSFGSWTKYKMATADITRDTSTMSGIHLQKWENVVQLSIRGASINSSGSIGTFPSGYRPMGYMYAACMATISNNMKPAQLTIEADGTTKVVYFNGTGYSTATSGYLNGNVTFLVN